MADADLTAQRLRELFHYNAEHGVFIRISSPFLKKLGTCPATTNNYGYPIINVDGRLYLAHRLAWLWTYGKWPGDQLDHINGMKDDYRLKNLREAGPTLNRQNIRKPTSANTTGYLGVSRNHRKFRATIKVDGVLRYLGNFETPEEAAEAYIAAKRKLHEGCTI